MEQWFKFALGMFVLIGCLHAKSLWRDSLGLGVLERDISCQDNVTFKSPTNLTLDCHAAAVKTVMDELEYAKTQCKGPALRIVMTQEALAKEIPASQLTNSSDCKWDNEGSKVKFHDFVTAIKVLQQSLNVASAN